MRQAGTAKARRQTKTTQEAGATKQKDKIARAFTFVLRNLADGPAPARMPRRSARGPTPRRGGSGGESVGFRRCGECDTGGV